MKISLEVDSEGTLNVPRYPTYPLIFYAFWKDKDPLIFGLMIYAKVELSIFSVPLPAEASQK